uniref:Large ribosomal subunit protein uL3m n=1 Tax=Lygus hesperus TaxID=30085 RepID=A0A0K8T0I6_LYGHE
MAGICNKLLSLNPLKGFKLLEGTNGCDCVSGFNKILNLQVRHKRPSNPKLRFPLWYLQKTRVEYPEKITPENREFIKEVTYEKFGPPAVISGIPTYQTSSPLKDKPLEKGVWTPKSRRCGLITRKIGQYPMWTSTGKIIWSTLLQVVDNHVVKYTPPELVDSPRKPDRFLRPNKYGCILVGAESCDPQKFTREYCGLFAPAGLPPKRVLGRFFVTPEAAIQPGTPLSALHFQPGDTVDVVGKTIDRGFQGVMKRWGFKGQPASHGQTKTHRRPGNVGGGGKRAGIWPGTKMPGHMGNRTRFLRGLKIWRINTKYNILYVQGLGVPGGTNSIVYVYDTLLPFRKRKDVSKPPPFPTYDPSMEEDLEDDLYDVAVHQFGAPSIKFDVDKK